MITPGLFRRPMRRSLRWRVLLLWWASLIVPGAIAAAPVFAVLRTGLDHSPAAADAVAWMDGSTLLEVLRKLGEEDFSQSLAFGIGAAALAVAMVAPFVAGAMVASARRDEPLTWPALLSGAGELYATMLRTTLAGLIPLGAGAALAFGIAKLAVSAGRRAFTETAARREFAAAAVAAAVVLFLCHLLVDAARSQFAADRGGRSALMAMWRGLRLAVRHPIRTVAVGGLGALAGLGVPAFLMALRLQIPQRGVASMALAWLLTQGAHVAIGYGRFLRIEGLSELSRSDGADRSGRDGSITSTGALGRRL